MSTIHQPVHHHTGLYVTAAALVAAGLLAALIAAVFWPSNGSDGTPPAQNGDSSSVRPYHGSMFHELCFAHRPGQSIELTQLACAP